MASTPGDDLASHVNNGECLPRAVTVGTQEREIGAGRGGCGCNCGSLRGDEEQRASGTTGAMGAAHGPGGSTLCVLRQQLLFSGTMKRKERKVDGERDCPPRFSETTVGRDNVQRFTQQRQKERPLCREE